MSSMSDDGRGLPDMLATVPWLLRKCAPGYTIRVLRLVSKDLSVTAMRVVGACSVQLGEGACPTPRQLIQIMQPARLTFLTVTIITTSGRPGPTLQQQLATCTTQVAELVQEMRAAIKNVAYLILKFQHHRIRSSRSSAGPSCSNSISSTTTTTTTSSSSSSNPQGPAFEASCPTSFAVLHRTVCAILAAALPSLRSLSLHGCCTDPAFASFGASCLHLRDLRVEALSLPVIALEGVTTHLPKLRTFTLTSPTLCPSGSLLTEYVEASLNALQAPTLLTSVSILFDGRKDLLLECKPNTWLNLPPSLQHFNCQCTLRNICNAPALLSSLRTLCVVESPRFGELIQILRLSPHLRDFSASSSPGCVVWCGEEDTIPGILLLRDRLHAGLELSFPAVHLVGSNADIAAVLTAMPALPYVTTSCVLQFIGDPQPNCLADVARVFPHLLELTLLTDSPMLDTPVVGAQLLEALAACIFLDTLCIRVQMSHVTSDLVRVCLSMPGLRVLQFVTAAGVSLPTLESAFSAQGRELDVQEMLL